MIGNLFLKFKTCPCENNSTFVLSNSKSHECCITIGLADESQLTCYLEEKMEEIIRETNCIPIKDNEYTYDVDYTFEEIAIESEDDENDVEYDFRKMIV